MNVRQIWSICARYVIEMCIFQFQVVAEVAAPLSQAKKITMVSSGSGEMGAAKLTGEVLQIVNKVPELVKSITGVDISRVGANSKYI